MNEKKIKKLKGLLDKSAKKVDEALSELEKCRTVYYKIKHELNRESTEVFCKNCEYNENFPDGNPSGLCDIPVYKDWAGTKVEKRCLCEDVNKDNKCKWYKEKING